MTTRQVVRVAGWKQCSFFRKAANAVTAMTHLYPQRIEADIQEHPDRDAYKDWLDQKKNEHVETFGERAGKHTSSPFVWKNSNEFIGGCDDTLDFIRQSFTAPASIVSPIDASMVAEAPVDETKEFDYDIIVIGGGSGGLATSKEAAKYGAKVAVLDYVKPSPVGTTWGLGGTCVNVGCIPKKLMHQSALIGKILESDASAFGWTFPQNQHPEHNWSTMVTNVQDYIRSLNFKYRVDLRDKKVKYENLLGKFIDPYTLECTNPKKGKPPKKITAKRFVIAVGGRPHTLSCEGGELAISSDDLFSMPESPGKTLIVGASYVALECAGFLKGMGLEVEILVRSILLRGFDQDMAERIGNYMTEEENIVLHRRCTPKNLEKLDNGKIKVTWINSSSDSPTEMSDVYDTVFNATGRYADLSSLGLEHAGVTINPKSGKIVTVNEQTNVPHIYAIGDVLDDKPELTPVAIQSGRFLAQRLFNDSKVVMNYDKICTAVFTPIEYGSCGLSEEKATEIFGASNLEVYHQSFNPLEWSLSSETRKDNQAYVKLICDLQNNKSVIGFHYLGPNAGEVTQAVGVAMRLNASFEDFIQTVGIHPTTAEIFTTLSVTKNSGGDAAAGGC